MSLPGAGDRLCVVRWGPAAVDDNLTVPPGTEGTVTEVKEEVRQIWVNWDNGSWLALIIGHDEYEMIEDG